ncbi:MAG TPA: hypothetical protein VK470_07295 [Bacteroidota bacterium]|nr:hypothetical protein [Bacteroidota bacterium]
MTSSEKTSLGRRRFFGAIGLGAAALVAVARNPFTMVFGQRRGAKRVGTTDVTISPNPMAVQRTKKGAAYHG